ncbi:hypothetical protein AC579_7500 [Pseudocercospora musae]|uniref:TeaA receptor TeaR n=1 Tax=Pseudocercospora musae TaxID=113226 RepID=A0A139IBJ4_9PEZI|nr:hypothetical protein AC579_7500 [Pseudocercospora musae]
MAVTMNGNSWSYAVPLEESEGNARAYASRRADGHGHGHGERSTEKRTKQLEHRSSAWDLQSDTEAAKVRRTSMRANNSVAGRKRSRNALREKPAQQQKRPSDFSDDSAWIHRDKLAQIEIQEMAEAGIYVRPSRRSQSAGPAREDGISSRPTSRSASRRQTHEHVTHVDREYAAAYPSQEEYEQTRNRLASPATSPQHDEPPSLLSRNESRHEDAPDELPDEPAYHYRELMPEPPPPKQLHNARPSTSRIPVSRVSPVPVPQQVVERDSPAPRSRAGGQRLSGSWDEMQQYARKARSGSVGSAVLLDDPESKRTTTPPGSSSNKGSSADEGSPTKATSPKKVAPTGRKGSTTGSTIPQPRAPSASATRRPGSSAGRPSTSQYTPEGDPPWIATMYKPDPRLPPDQQMLPTHAKRMMQDKWEKEGKTGTIYDKHFNLLNEEDMRPKNSPPLTLHIDRGANGRLPPANTPSPKKISPSGSTAGNGWPLSARSEAGKSDASSMRPGTSGGYKITPTIPTTPSIQRSAAPSPVPPQVPMQGEAHNTTPRVPDLDEKQEAAPKKGCCCVIM